MPEQALGGRFGIGCEDNLDSQINVENRCTCRPTVHMYKHSLMRRKDCQQSEEVHCSLSFAFHKEFLT